MIKLFSPADLRTLPKSPNVPEFLLKIIVYRWKPYFFNDIWILLASKYKHNGDIEWLQLNYEEIALKSARSQTPPKLSTLNPTRRKGIFLNKQCWWFIKNLIYLNYLKIPKSLRILEIENFVLYSNVTLI